MPTTTNPDQATLDFDTEDDGSDETVAALELAVEDRPQDRVYVASDKLVHGLAGLRELTSDPDGLWSVELRNGHRVLRDMQDRDIDPESLDLPAWSDQWFTESRWASDQRHATDASPRLVWSVDETIVFQAPYIMSMDERLRAMNADVQWSDSIGGWVFPWFDDDMLDELRSITSDYGFMASAAASTLLNGTLESEIVIDETIEIAEDEGYRLPPAAFATSRTLKDHQKRGVLSALGRRRVLLADSPGLGKGGIFVSAFLSEFDLAIRDALNLSVTETYDLDDPAVREVLDTMTPVLLVCQTSLVMPLAEEIVHWWNDARISLVKGTAQADVADCDFIVCPNTTTMVNRLDDIMAAEPKGMIVDECHTLKNPDAKRTQAVKVVADSINARGDELVAAGERDSTLMILASGTPIPNAPWELWSLLNILGEQEVFADAALDALGDSTIAQPHKNFSSKRTKWTRREMSDKELFERRWCNAGFIEQPMAGKGVGWAWYQAGSGNLSELHRLLSDTVMIRRKKRDVIQLPAPYERIIPTPLSNEETEQYARIVEDFRNYMFDLGEEYAEKWDCSVAQALKRIENNVDFAEPLIQMAKLMQFVSQTKTHHIVEWVKRFMDGDEQIISRDAESRRKLIVFAHYKVTQKELVDNEELQSYGMATILAGSKDVTEQTRRFQKDDDCRLMICYSGAREGHTLTAAYDVLIAEPPSVPSQAEQMACRCYARVSEDFEPHVAYIHYAITPNTVDVLQLRRMNLKKGVSDAVIDGEDDPSKLDKKGKERLSREEKEAEASLLMEVVMRGDETMRIAT